MASVKKFVVPEDVYRVLATRKNEVNDFFIRRFQCTAKVTGPPIAAGPAPVKVYEKSLVGGTLITVWRDDLTRQDTDVVVNAANEQLGHWAGLAAALVKAGGQQIVWESEDWISKNGKLVVGDIAITSAGNLPCKKIVHAVGPRWSDGLAQRCMDQLREAIMNVLKYVSRESDLHSVAIPAVSSGIFSFPLDLCAEIIVDTVQTFCSNVGKDRLKEIRLVNHDDNTVQAMRTACEKILGISATSSHSTVSSSYSTASSSHSGAYSYSASASHSGAYSAQPKHFHQEASSHMSRSINGLNLHLKTGCIEDQRTDVIVNSVSSDLNLNTGAISKAIYMKAGKQMQDEIRKNTTWRASSMISTGGHNLPCKSVYHVILPLGYPYWAEKTLREVTKDCLMMVHTQKFSSISFPALGTGNVGMQKDKVADIMIQVVLDFARLNQFKMDVYFVIHPSDKDIFKAFQDKMRASGSLNNKNMEPTERRRAPEPSPEEMCVSIIGESDEDVEEAAAWLQGALYSTPLLIHNNLLLLFGSKEFDDLASDPSSAEIEEDLSNGRVTLRISGPQPDRVMAAIQAERLLLDVRDKFSESLEEELLEAAVIWIYENQSGSHRYPTKANRELEKAYGTQTKFTLNALPGHVIDIMNGSAREGNQMFTIRRLGLSDSFQKAMTSLMPENWRPQIRQVPPTSQEFNDRSAEFKKAGLILEEMEKVQNHLLAGVFQSKKDAVEKRLKKPSTERMYQLVPRQFYKKICAVGFHRLYATSIDTKYGVGVYFKKSLRNILARSHAPEKDRLHYIIQAEVVTGTATKYSKKDPVLPCVGSDALQVYDSLIDGGIPVEYCVIFDRFQAIPQYVFTCRKIV